MCLNNMESKKNCKSPKVMKIDLSQNETKKQLLKRLQRDYSIYEDRSCIAPNNNEKLKLSRQKFIEQKKEEYIQSFTIHGLTRVVLGKGLESFIWAVLLIFGIASCVYIFSTLVERYKKRESYVQIYSEPTRKKLFPSITFCEKNLLLDSFYSYCGRSLRFERNPSASVYCSGRKARPRKTDVSYIDENGNWTNGIFRVTECRSWGRRQCKKTKYLKSLDGYENFCFTWNYDGNFHDIYGHLEIKFDFKITKEVEKHLPPNTPIEVVAILHDHEITELDLTKQVRLDPDHKYDITIDKTEMYRLEAPFLSNCTYNTKEHHIFDGKYSRRSCYESHSFIKTYKQCGDIYDYVLQYIPENIKGRYSQNRSLAKTMECLRTYVTSEDNSEPDCPFPCTEIDLTVSSTFSRDLICEQTDKRNERKKEFYYNVNVQFQTVDTTRKIVEKELYSWDQLACEIGGFIGVVIGASVMSIAEVISFCALYVTGKWFKVAGNKGNWL